MIKFSSMKQWQDVANALRSVTRNWEVEVNSDGLMFSTREHGDPSYDEHSDIDMRAGKKLASYIRSKFPSLQVSLYPVNEWVYVEVDGDLLPSPEELLGQYIPVIKSTLPRLKKLGFHLKRTPVIDKGRLIAIFELITESGKVYPTALEIFSDLNGSIVRVKNSFGIEKQKLGISPSKRDIESAIFQVFTKSYH